MLKYRIPVPLVRIKFELISHFQGTVAFNAKEAYVIARKFGPDYNRKFVVKAQVRKRSLYLIFIKSVDLSEWKKRWIFQRKWI